ATRARPCAARGGTSSGRSAGTLHREAVGRAGGRELRPAVSAERGPAHADPLAHRTLPVSGLGTERELPDQIGDRCPQAVRRRRAVVVRDLGGKSRELALDGGNGGAQAGTLRIGNGI